MVPDDERSEAHTKRLENQAISTMNAALEKWEEIDEKYFPGNGNDDVA